MAPRALASRTAFVAAATIASSCIALNPAPPDDGAGGEGGGANVAGANGGRPDVGGAGQTGHAGDGAAGEEPGTAGESGGQGAAGGAAGEPSGASGGDAAGSAGSAGSGGLGGLGGGAGTAGSGGISPEGGSAGEFAEEDPGDPPEPLALSGSLGVHDPAVMFVDGTYYLFYTGPGITTKRSTDLTTWQETNVVFASNPAWIATQIPRATDLWAPDISYFGGQYHLYYSASSFGSNRSCIGHATQATIDGDAWVDRGPLICSNVTATYDDWNAIDPNVVLDGAGTPWLAFGSFWGGIKLIRLDHSGARADAELHAIAARTDSPAVEAPFIVRRGPYYYLFVSFDSCCRGLNSTYNLRVGRSTFVHGPYVDADGVSLLIGGGTRVLSGNEDFRGPGHNAVLVRGDDAFNVYHAYGAPSGAPILRISELVWNAEGWPLSAGP